MYVSSALTVKQITVTSPLNFEKKITNQFSTKCVVKEDCRAIVCVGILAIPHQKLTVSSPLNLGKKLKLIF